MIMDREHLIELLESILDTIDRAVLGSRSSAEVLLAAFMAGGHALVEGVPGIGKTLLARCFAGLLGVDFKRIQFTPDLMPSDVTGVNIFDQESGSFRLTRGPIFTQVLMADEINRTPPKTQAALLEAMQERQVTIDGTSYPLAPPFFVIATQNPIEFEGTYPLPEAQLDRFLVRVEMGLPKADAELEILRLAASGKLGGWSAGAQLPPPMLAEEQVKILQDAGRSVHVSEEVLTYLQQLAMALRESPHVEIGVSPRGVLALLEVARAGAVIEGRDYLTPDDIKRFMKPCWGHRFLLTPESELEGETQSRNLEQVADSVEVPHLVPKLSDSVG
jgi:MoxR-like ATPase